MDARTFSAVLDFIYLRECAIDDDLLQPVLEAACRLQLEDLQISAENEIVQRISADTCLDAWDLAEHLSLSRLEAVAKNLALTCFEQVRASAAFVRVSASRMGELLASDCLTVEKEEDAFHALTQWLDAQGEPPAADTIEGLIAKIRFPLITPAPARRAVETSPLMRRHAAVVLAQRHEEEEAHEAAAALTPHTRKRLSMMAELKAVSAAETAIDHHTPYAAVIITATSPLVVNSLCLWARTAVTLYHRRGDHSHVGPFDVPNWDSQTLTAAGGQDGACEPVVFTDLRLSLGAGESCTFVAWSRPTPTLQKAHTGVGLSQNVMQLCQLQPGFADVAQLKPSEATPFIPRFEMGVYCY